MKQDELRTHKSIDYLKNSSFLYLEIFYIYQSFINDERIKQVSVSYLVSLFMNKQCCILLEIVSIALRVFKLCQKFHRQNLQSDFFLFFKYEEIDKICSSLRINSKTSRIIRHNKIAAIVQR